MGVFIGEMMIFDGFSMKYPIISLKSGGFQKPSETQFLLQMLIFIIDLFTIVSIVGLLIISKIYYSL